MILDNPQPYWTRVPAAEWFTFDNNELIFNEDGSMIVPKDTVAWVYNTSYFRSNDPNCYIRIIGETYEGYNLFVSCGDYGEWNVSNLEIGNNIVLHDGYPYVYYIMATSNAVKINYIDYVYLSDIPSNPEPGWIRYDMSDINSVKNVLSENANITAKTGSISTNIIPIENCIIEENGNPPFLRLELNEFKNISDEYFNYIRSKIFLKRNGTFKIVGRTMQLDAFDSQTSPIYPNSQEYNVNINMIPYYDEFYWINEQQNFNQDAKVIAMITEDKEFSGSIELTPNYPYFPAEVTNGSMVQILSAIDILYIDEYIGQSSNKISEIVFDTDFDKATHLGTFIEVKYLDIKANGVSILDKNPIVKYWNNYNHTVRIFNPEGERFGTSLGLYFQIECDGYETSDVIYKDLKMIHIDGYHGDYSGGGSGGGLAHYAYHNNDNYKKSEARILIPLTNTSFISYKK